MPICLQPLFVSNCGESDCRPCFAPNTGTTALSGCPCSSPNLPQSCFFPACPSQNPPQARPFPCVPCRALLQTLPKRALFHACRAVPFPKPFPSAPFSMRAVPCRALFPKPFPSTPFVKRALLQNLPRHALCQTCPSPNPSQARPFVKRALLQTLSKRALPHTLPKPPLYATYASVRCCDKRSLCSSGVSATP